MNKELDLEAASLDSIPTILRNIAEKYRVKSCNQRDVDDDYNAGIEWLYISQYFEELADKIDDRLA